MGEVQTTAKADDKFMFDPLPARPLRHSAALSANCSPVICAPCR
jgi:hypothetical protein